MNCDRIRPDLALYVYGELTFDQEEAFERHLSECAECAAELNLLRSALETVDSAEVATPPGLAAACRRDLMAAVRAESRPSVRGAWRAFSLWLSPVWLKPAGAVALLALGFLGGRLIPGANPGTETALAPAALRVRSVATEPGERVRILLDETRRREVSGSLRDSQIRELLVAATQDASNAGLRVESVGLLEGQSSAEEVRHALMDALAGDPNPGVRLKALEALRPYAGETAVRRTLGQVLLQDDNTGVRKQVADLVTERHARDMVDVFQQLMEQEQDQYIRQRIGRALVAMKASAQSF